MIKVARNHLLFSVCAVLLLFSIFLFFDVEAQAETQFSGIISTDTTWTKVNSPYEIIGATAIIENVTLTIEPGVTVNLGNNYLQVNGTLIAKGSFNDPIYLNGGRLPAIVFTNSSGDWD